MATAAIPSTTTFAGKTTASGSSTSSSSSSSAGGLGGLTAADFMHLMVAQLQNQDPMSPDSSDSLLNQTAALSQVEGVNQLNTSLTQMLASQQLSQGAALIGMNVTYQPSGSDSPQSGVVSGLSMVNGQAQLAIGSTNVPLSQVQSVKAA